MRSLSLLNAFVEDLSHLFVVVNVVDVNVVIV